MWKAKGYLIRTNGTERPALQWLRDYLSGTGVEESTRPILGDYKLYQNHPNPFNPSTTIEYSLSGSSKVKLTIYNTLGVKIRTLVDSYQDMGEHLVVWDGKDDQNNPVSSGIYFYRLERGAMNFQKKMILICVLRSSKICLTF